MSSYPTWPATPGVQKMDLISHEESEERITRLARRYVINRGGQRWIWLLTYPPMTRETFNDLKGMILGRLGSAGGFLFSPFIMKDALGSAGGSPVVKDRQNMLTYSEGGIATYVLAINCSDAPAGHGFEKWIQVAGEGSASIATKNVTLATSTDFTISAWVRRNDLAVPQVTLSQDSGDLIFYAGGHYIEESEAISDPIIQHWRDGIYRCSVSFNLPSLPVATAGIFQTVNHDDTPLQFAGIQVEEDGLGAYVKTEASILSGQDNVGRWLGTQGWTAETTILKAGDFIKLEGDDKIYQVARETESDGAGGACLPLTPTLTIVPQDGDDIAFDNIPFVVTMESDLNTIDVNTALHHGFQIGLREKVVV